MSAELVLQRLRHFLLWLVAFVCAGTVVELWLSEHTETLTQFIPFVLAGLGLVAVLLAILRPGRATLLARGAVMVLLVVGSALGVYEHLAANVEFEMEIRPTATLGAVLMDALMGASPLLAPGILALAALIALAASYYHPALAQRT